MSDQHNGRLRAEYEHDKAEQLLRRARLSTDPDEAERIRDRARLMMEHSESALRHSREMETRDLPEEYPR